MAAQFRSESIKLSSERPVLDFAFLTCRGPIPTENTVKINYP
jgi:hypothetical protein